MKKRPHPIFRLLKLLFYIALLPLLYVVGVIGYTWYNDYEPAPETTVTEAGTPHSQQWLAEDSVIRLFNWNIGYAGLGAKSDFWKDGGEMVHSDKEIVEEYLAGITSVIRQYRDTADFFLLQEVDRNSARSYHIDQAKALAKELPGFGWSFGKNYDVDYIPVPLLDPYGGVESGLVTFATTKAESIARFSFEGNYAFPTGLFYLDRCYLLSRFPLNSGKQLVVINTHNSAYDDGTLKKRQMAQMAEVLKAEYAKGNFVIVGGDWNQMPPGFAGLPGFPVKASSGINVPEVYPEAGWTWA
ncbi:MAG: endonuclease/exonuclease/phosphatase family protein, partial [Bacteroidia bacterium]